MNNIFASIRNQIDAAATRSATRHLDNHILKDIGLPERGKMPNLYHL